MNLFSIVLSCPCLHSDICFRLCGRSQEAQRYSMHLKFYITLGFLRASTKASADILLK